MKQYSKFKKTLSYEVFYSCPNVHYQRGRFIFSESGMKIFNGHYDPDLKKSVFPLFQASAMRIDLACFKDRTLISEGFNNWKKAIEKFKSHQTSHIHVLSANQLIALKRPLVSVKIHA